MEQASRKPYVPEVTPRDKETEIDLVGVTDEKVAKLLSIPNHPRAIPLTRRAGYELDRDPFGLVIVTHYEPRGPAGTDQQAHEQRRVDALLRYRESLESAGLICIFDPSVPQLTVGAPAGPSIFAHDTKDRVRRRLLPVEREQISETLKEYRDNHPRERGHSHVLPEVKEYVREANLFRHRVYQIACTLLREQLDTGLYVIPEGMEEERFLRVLNDTITGSGAGRRRHQLKWDKKRREQRRALYNLNYEDEP